MKKGIRMVMALAMTGMLAIGAGNNVFAADSNFNTTVNAADTPTINLLKDYVTGSDSQVNTKSPEEFFIFTIERYGLWNVGEDGSGKAKYEKDNMPTFENGSQTEPKNRFTIHAEEKSAENKDAALSTSIDVPVYEAVGDYWYKVTETDNQTAGVLYGTNDKNIENVADENGNHSGVYYLHVQVTNAGTKGQYVRTVTLHKTAPDVANVTTNTAYEAWYQENGEDDKAAKKVNDIQNKYYAGSLNIVKEVTGNAGDKNELFKVTVVFQNQSKANMNSDIVCRNYYDANGNLISESSLGWNDKVTGAAHSKETFQKDVYIKDGTTISFDNIPYGVTYTITETRPDDDKYTHSFAQTDGDAATTFDGVTLEADAASGEGETGTLDEKWNAANATGSIADDSDTVTITNHKESMIDIGVITSNAPYIAILIFAGIVMIIFLHRRKWMNEE